MPISVTFFINLDRSVLAFYFVIFLNRVSVSVSSFSVFVSVSVDVICLVSVNEAFYFRYS